MKVAVIGCGHLGNFHLDKWLRIPGVDVVGVCDSDPGRAWAAHKKTAEHYFPYDPPRAVFRPFTDPEELLEKMRPDAVSIAVPTAFHCDVAAPFLEGGVHVLLEKPIAASLEEADYLIETAERKGVVFQVGLIERFNPAIMMVRGYLGTPLFIEAHRLHPFHGRGTDIDVVRDLMIHDLDLVQALSGADIKGVEIHAAGSPVISANVDIANARLKFTNGLVANLTASRVTGRGIRKINLYERDRYYSVDCARRTVDWVRRENDNGDGVFEIVQESIPVMEYDPLEVEVLAFVSAIESGRSPQVTGREARKSLELAVKINEIIGRENPCGSI